MILLCRLKIKDIAFRSLKTFVQIGEALRKNKFRELMYKRQIGVNFPKKRICTQYYFILYEARCQEKTKKNRHSVRILLIFQHKNIFEACKIAVCDC